MFARCGFESRLTPLRDAHFRCFCVQTLGMKTQILSTRCVLVLAIRLKQEKKIYSLVTPTRTQKCVGPSDFSKVHLTLIDLCIQIRSIRNV